MSKHRLSSVVVVFFGLCGQAAVTVAEQTWVVHGGTSNVAFDQTALEDFQLTVMPSDGHSEYPQALGFGYQVSESSTVRLISDDGILETMSGEIHHVGNLLLSTPGGEVLLKGLVIRTVASQEGSWLVITSGQPGDYTPLFELQMSKVGFDRIGRSLLIEAGDLTATQALAEALGNPKIKGKSIGNMKVVIEVQWAGGDEPVQPDDELQPNLEGEGGVAGGNNGTVCPNPVGPDVIVGELPDFLNYASSGGIEAFAVGTTSCNIGNQTLLWVSNTNQHPIIGQNMFRLKTGRFEHIGQAWLKHGFLALAQNACGCGCTNPGNGALLGIGCSDPYCATLNGQQDGMGPKNQVNAHTGVYTFPHDTSTGNSIYKRLQVKITDLDPALSGGGQYFVEGHYVTPDDASNGNQNNNASYRSVTISGAGSAWSIASLNATTQRQQPGIRAWKDTDSTVTETDIQVSGDGLFILSSKATDNGNGTWHFEYALQNLNSDRSGGSFSIPVDAAATVTNIGFHDVDYHSGEPYALTDWTGSFSGGAVTWNSPQTFAQNPNTNALRWGTLYNFRFDANRLPAGSLGTATLGLFKTGSPGSVTGAAVVPAIGPADCNMNGIEDACDVSCAGACSGVVGCGLRPDCNMNGTPDECETTDCNMNGSPDDCDIAAGNSNDCNANVIPDECETFPATPITSIRVASGLSSPLGMYAPEGDSRLFIVEQGGRIKILSGGSVLGTPYLDVSGLVSCCGERGLLGLAFHPNFSSNGFFFINYTNTAGNTVIARYQATGGNPASNTANPASAVILKTINQDFANHNGGCLQFGKDGYLYCGMGDGGSGNDPNGRAQDTGQLLGKMLRLDVDNSPTYIPATNPFVGPGNPLDEIWAIGMRNPWRFSFDRTLGHMYIGDVGQDTNEEIDYEPFGIAGGRNYGWRCMEGTSCTGLTGCTCNAPALTLPIVNVPQSTSGFCSIIGGFVYRGCAIPDLSGTYFYADLCANQIWSFRYNGTTLTNHANRTSELEPDEVGTQVDTIVSFGEDGFGELYWCSQGNNSVFKIVPDVGPVCGNGIVEVGEECEPPNTATCDGSCQTIDTGCVTPVLNDTFETSIPGWSVTTTASTGAWVRVDPVGTLAQPEDDHTGSGTLCYVTGQGGVGGALGDADVDNGTTTLTSPTLNLAGGGTISYWRWYSNAAGAAPNTETFRVDISNNNGGSWTNVETIGPSGAGTSGGWIEHQFNVASIIAPSSQMRVRFIAEDLPGNGGSIVEAGVDDFRAVGEDCNGNCVSDTTDIGNGTSEDCNANLIPDECEFGDQLKSYEIEASPSVSIPDQTGVFVSHSFTVPDSGAIVDLNVDLQLSHTWNGDLTVRLQHGATTITLIDRPGLPVGGDPTFGFDNDGFDIMLDDEGTGGSIETINSGGGLLTSPPSYTPNNPLSAFDGVDKVGIWTISAADFAQGDTGSIDHWSLHFTNQGAAPGADCNDNGIEDSCDLSSGDSQDCNMNGIPDECDIADATSQDCDGGPVGVRAGGEALINLFCFGCHDSDGSGGPGFPGPNIRNRSRVFIWNKLLPPTDHPGGAHPEFDDQDFADLEAFLADGGSRGRPDRVPDECQTLPDCDMDGAKDGCELEAGTQVDVDYNGIPDPCEACATSAECDDGVFCNGAEICNPGTHLCEDGALPCTPLQVCDEGANACVDIPVMSCSLNTNFASAGGSVTLSLWLDGSVASLRGYQVTAAMILTLGTGTVTGSCPDGVVVDTARGDYVFAGQQSFTAVDCTTPRAAAAMFTAVPVPQGTYYLATMELDVSPGAAPGSTFEISIGGKPGSYLRDGNDDPILYAIDVPCNLTIVDCGPPVASAAGPRYIDASFPNGTSPVALRVTGDQNDVEVDCVSEYVQADGSLGGAAVFLTPAEWGLVHIHGDEIIPGTLYLVQGDCGPMPGTTLSPPINVTTFPWGDVNDDGVVDINDILCVVDGFGGNHPFCSAQADDLDPCEPDGVIDIDDILKVIDAFGGAPYPCADPCS